MRKVSQTTHKRFVASAEEAKHLGLHKLATAVLNGLGPMHEEIGSNATYSKDELESLVYQTLWKLAIETAAYHDLTKVDILKIDAAVKSLKNQVIDELESSMKVLGYVSKREPKLPGQE
jgi:hypothetical protein